MEDSEIVWLLAKLECERIGNRAISSIRRKGTTLALINSQIVSDIGRLDNIRKSALWSHTLAWLNEENVPSNPSVIQIERIVQMVLHRYVWEASPIAQIADAVGNRIARDIVSTMKIETDVRMVGDNGSLKNLFDDYAVQCFRQHGLGWDLLEDYVFSIIYGEAGTMRELDLIVVWLDSDRGWNWLNEDEYQCDNPPIDIAEIARHIHSKYFDALADKHVVNSPRLERYLNG